MSKTELDIKLNEHLINAAREIQLHCKGTKDCEDCIFVNKTYDGYIRCRINDIPVSWEVEHEQL